MTNYINPMVDEYISTTKKWKQELKNVSLRFLKERGCNETEHFIS